MVCGKNDIITKELLKKIERKVMYNPTEKGCLKILNIEAIQSAVYLHWVEKNNYWIILASLR